MATKRGINIVPGSGISATPVDNTTTGQQDWTITNTSPGIATPVSVSNGGTGDTSLAAHDVLVGNGTSPITAVSPGSFGLVLTSHGTLVDPSFDQIDLAGSLTQLANALPVPHGGTGVATLTAHTVLVGAGTGTVVQVGPGSSGQVLTSNGAADPSFQSLPITSARGTGTNGSVSTSSTSAALATATITVASGQTVDITMGVDLNTVDNAHPMDLQMVLVEDGTSILNNVITIAPNTISPFNTNMYGVFFASRTPAAGSHTYALKITNNSSTTTVNWSQAYVRAYAIGV